MRMILMLAVVLGSGAVRGQVEPVGKPLEVDGVIKRMYARSGQLYVEANGLQIFSEVPNGYIIGPVAPIEIGGKDEVTLDEPAFTGLGMLDGASSQMRVKVRPRDSLAVVIYADGKQEKWDLFPRQQKTLAAYLTRPVVTRDAGSLSKQTSLYADPGVSVIRRQIVAAAVDGSVVWVLYGAVQNGCVVVGRFEKQGPSVVSRYVGLKLPAKGIAYPLHLAASGESLWIGGEGRIVAEYHLGLEKD